MPEITEEQLANAQAIAKANLTPETFDFAEAVSDRSYPEFEVEVYLDEKNIQKFIEVHDRRLLIEGKIRASEKPTVQQAEELEKIDYEYHEVTKSLESAKYVIKIRGIAPEKSMELEKLAEEQFPIEYEEEKNPLTGAVVKTPKEDEKRDAYYANLIRQAHFVSVTAPNGAVDTNFSDVAKVHTIVNRLPFLARHRVDEAINNATITADFYRVLADPVF